MHMNSEIINKKNPHIITVGAVLPRFNLDGGINSATLTSLLDHGLQSMIDQGIGAVLCDNSDYAVALFQKYIPVAPYDQMMTYMRKREDIEVISTLDQLSSEKALELLTTANNLRINMEAVAAEKGHEITHSYIYQHVGADDKYPRPSHNTSYAPLHLHVTAFGPHLDQFKAFDTLPSLNMRDSKYKHLENDPTTLIVLELIRAIFPENFSGAYQKSNSAAIMLSINDINEPISIDEIRLLQRISVEWKNIFREISHCFSDYSLDSNDRPIPFAFKQISENLKTLFTKSPYKILSERSKKILMAISGLLKPSSEVDEWAWFYKDICGAITFEFDIKNQKRSLILSPRITMATSRHYPAMTPAILRIRDEKKHQDYSTVNPVAVEELYPIYSRIIQKMQISV